MLERFGDKNKIENMNAVFSEYLLDIDFENINIPRLQITKNRFPSVGSYVFV